MDRVELLFVTNYTDTYTISLTVREGTYDGPILGVSTLELLPIAGAVGVPPSELGPSFFRTCC